MLKFTEDTPIYFKTGIKDMRKSINWLAGLVENDGFRGLCASQSGAKADSA